KLAEIHYIRQKEPLGLGHAVWCARKFIGDEPFAVLLGDDIMRSDPPCLARMIDLHERSGSSVVATIRVPEEDVSKYGIVAPLHQETAYANSYRIQDLLEKPKREEAPSNMAIIGRYILDSKIF